MPTPSIILCDADGLALHGSDADLIVLSFSRSEIERGLVGDAVDRLLVLSDSQELTQRCANRVLLNFDGYNPDPRELHEIPEVRCFFRQVAQAWNLGWFHFLEKEAGSIGLLLRLLLDVKTVKGSHGVVGSELTDPEELPKVLLHLFTGMNALYANHGFSIDENIAMSNRVMKAVDQAFGLE